MHIYLYDSFLAQKKYDNILAKIETKITDLGLNGRIIRLNLMNSVYSAIENEVKRGAKTIIAVGRDQLFSQALNSMAALEKQKIFSSDLPLGYIPIGKNSQIGPCLGIHNEEQACNIISARRCEKMDLGLANNNFFLSQAVINSKNTIINIDDEYALEAGGAGHIMIVNLPFSDKLPNNVNFSAQDGKLELLVSPDNGRKLLSFGKKPEMSIFRFKKLLLINKNEPVIIDDSIKISAPVEIMTAKEKITLIVGKGRVF